MIYDNASGWCSGKKIITAFFSFFLRKKICWTEQVKEKSWEFYKKKKNQDGDDLMI